jgi:hypothetical protein
MIALLDDLPLITLRDGNAMQLDLRWLRHSLDHAAAQAGYEKWWQAEMVTHSIADFLRNDYEAPSLPIECLEECVRTVLCSIGFPEISLAFRPLPPPARIYLQDLAREAGDGFELAFFELLRNKIRDLRISGTTHVDCLGLKECVKILRRKSSWSRDCSGLRTEIVLFIQAQFAHTEGERSVLLQLA